MVSTKHAGFFYIVGVEIFQFFAKIISLDQYALTNAIAAINKITNANAAPNKVPNAK